MLHTHLYRVHEIPDKCIKGIMVVQPDIVLATLELPYKDNATNVSCIPAGSYFIRDFYILDVPDRTAIKIHIGNTRQDIKGCIIVGLKFGILVGEPAVLASAPAFEILREVMDDKVSRITIYDY